MNWALGGASLATLLVTSAPAMAQETRTNPIVSTEQADSDDRSTIIVTGQRQSDALGKSNEARLGVLGERDILSTPFSVTSFSEELGRNIQAISVRDLLTRDASVSMADPGFGDSLLIRGFSVNLNRGASFDGLPILVANINTTELIGRIDVIKGPNAFLTGGLDGIGGTFNIVPKRAADEDLTRVTGQFISRSTIGGSVDVGRRFGPDGAFGVRVNAGYREGGYFLDHSHDRRYFGAVGLDYRSSDVRAALDVSYERDTLRGYNYYSYFDAGVTKVIRPPDSSTLLQPRWMKSNQPYFRVQGNAEWDFAEGWTIGAALGRGEQRRAGYAWGYCDSTIILDDLGNAACTPDYYPSNRELWSGALTLRGKVETGPLTHRLSAVYNRTREDAGFVFFGSSDTYFFNIYNPQFPDQPPPEPDLPITRTLLRTSEGFTIGDEISAFDDRVIVTFGARRSEFRNRNYNQDTGAKTRDLSYHKWTPAAGIVVKPLPNISLYANYVEALSAGGQAPGNAVNAGELLGASVSDQIEIGAKAEFGPLRATIAAFRIKQPNEYLNLATRVYGRFGEKRNQGIEASLQGALKPGLTVLASVMYLDAKLRNTADGPDADTIGDLDGKRASGASRWQGALSADWELPGLDGFALNAGLTYTGKTFVDDTNVFVLPAWTRVDAGVRYPFTVGGKHVTARVNVQNLFDLDKWMSIYGGGGGISTIQPRTVIASLSVDL